MKNLFKIFSKKKKNTLIKEILLEISYNINTHKYVLISEDYADEFNLYKYLITNYYVEYNVFAQALKVSKKPYKKEFIEDLLDIKAICVDYAGYRTIKGLKSLIDDIKDYTERLITKWENK